MIIELRGPYKGLGKPAYYRKSEVDGFNFTGDKLLASDLDAHEVAEILQNKQFYIDQFNAQELAVIKYAKPTSCRTYHMNLIESNLAQAAYENRDTCLGEIYYKRLMESLYERNADCIDILYDVAMDFSFDYKWRLKDDLTALWGKIRH